ncbi:40S ribosomal protein S4 [Capsicum annuum]|nr:40S ribosomal protein S4 [Capsicum annuum]
MKSKCITLVCYDTSSVAIIDDFESSSVTYPTFFKSKHPFENYIGLEVPNVLIKAFNAWCFSKILFRCNSDCGLYTCTLAKYARGLKKHLKRLNAPKHWMLDKLGGAFAPKPSSGPHKSRECLPLIIILRNRLKYALTYREVISILMQRQVMVDGKVRTDKTYPAGFMDVVSIPKTNENFRLLYDTKGRFRLHSLRDEEAKFKLCKVRSVQFGQKGIPYLNTYDGRTIRYPDPLIKANDTIKLDLESNKIVDFIKFDVGNVVMVTGGRNRGRVGVIKNREKHKGSFETVHIQDSLGHEFATRLGNVFTLGKGTKPWVSLPKGKGIKLSIIEEARKRLAAQSAVAA